ncbi:MAG: hypothetical protein OXT49_02600 [Gammaproteobacteria bacterium]|nr:hypothetical protein [Gammaproteobacteria bacterium]
MKFTKQLALMGLLLSALFSLAACSGSPGDAPGIKDETGEDTDPPEPPAQDAACNAPADAQMPATPAAGQSRDGLSCGIHIAAPGLDGEIVAFQVFEPTTLVGGQTYPIILEGHGFSGSRQGSDTSNARILRLRDEGYGVISIDQAGHGETGGFIKVMDPDQEGEFLVAIVDWAQANLDWHAVGPDLDAGEDNMVLGAMGSSYGGGYQHILQAVDPQKRLDALVPEITWHDLTYSLFPNTVIKGAWDAFLFTAGNSAGGGGNFDPYVTNLFVDGFANNNITQENHDYFRYHGPGYFCDGIPVDTNGGPGTAPQHRDPVPPMTAAHILYFQGFRDPLFNYLEAFQNYQCFNNLGGDVRLFSYQSGHNTIEVVVDRNASQPPNNSLISSCGDINVNDAAVAWFNRYLKGDENALNGVLDDHEVCFSLSGTDAVFADRIISGTNGSEFNVAIDAGALGQQPVVVNPTVDGAIPVPLYTAPAGGDVFAGIPHLELSITDPSTVGNSDTTIIFVGVGFNGTRTGAQWELMDNQLTPIRGTYSAENPISIPMVGVAERLEAGDQLGLLFYGANTNQYPTTGSRANDGHATSVQVTGRVWFPLLGNEG